MRRVILKAIAVLVLLAAIAAAGGYHYLRRSLPQIDGTTRVAGLSAPIEIIRDADAIPHIVASNKLDGLFGLGYAHAQDRLWQMEFQRRIGHGRLSEVLGAATLPQDRFLRTVGFARAARAAWTSTPDWAKQQVNAYVAGINAFISTHHGAGLPPELRKTCGTFVRSSKIRGSPHKPRGPALQIKSILVHSGALPSRARKQAVSRV